MIEAGIVDETTFRALEASLETCASSWLSISPIRKYGFNLNKQTFWDGIYIRYNIPLPRMPSFCPCSSRFTMEHALSCMKGGFISIRHNEVRDFTAELITETCSDVSIETPLQRVTNEKFQLRTANVCDEARVDVAARGVWARGQIAYLDVRVFNPLAKTYLNQSLSDAYKKNEQEEKCYYNERILQIEQGTFTPLVFTCFGGMGREYKTFSNRVTELLADK